MGDRHGGIPISLAVVCRVAAPFGEFVGNERDLLVFHFIDRRLRGGTSGSARSQHSHEVAIPYRAFGQFLTLATGRPE